MDDGDDNAFFRLKAIGFGGRNVPILAQNENGPCPLLAIANVLLLRGSIEIHPDRPQVSYEELVELVGDYLLTSNQHASASAELSANHAQNLSDCMAMFPTLRRGLDINVRFTGCLDFEYTAEHIVFDLCRVRMLHGWIVDRQDKEAARVIGSCTYNQLIEKVIECNSLIPEEDARPQQPTPAPTPRQEPPAPAAPSASLQASAHACEADAEGGDAGAQLVAASAPTPAYALPYPGTPATDDASADAAAAQAARAAVPLAAQAAPLASAVPAAGEGLSEAERERIVREGLVVQEFLATTASQLTFLGLVELHSTVHENELCAFFRNNHFSCMYKRDGELFVLITDLGYLHEQAVWERLDQLDGDTTLCNADFAVCSISERQQDHELCAVVGPAVPPPSAHVPQGDLLSADFVARHAAELAAAGAAVPAMPLPGSPHAAGADGARGDGGGSGAPIMDADLAMAMQLQAELDQEAAREAAEQRAAMAARTAQQAPSQRGGNAQQQAHRPQHAQQQAQPQHEHAGQGRRSTSASSSDSRRQEKDKKGPRPGCELM